jgi:hypothetical protein
MKVCIETKLSFATNVECGLDSLRSLQPLLLRPMGLDVPFFSLNSWFFPPEFVGVDTRTSRLQLSKICKRYGKREQLRTDCQVIKLRLFNESIDVLGSQLLQKMQKISRDILQREKWFLHLQKKFARTGAWRSGGGA